MLEPVNTKRNYKGRDHRNDGWSYYYEDPKAVSAAVTRRSTCCIRSGTLKLRKPRKDVSFVLHKGEILGFSGLMGAGRTEVARFTIQSG